MRNDESEGIKQRGGGAGGLRLRAVHPQIIARGS